MGTYTPITPIYVNWKDLGTGRLTRHSLTTDAGGAILMAHEFNFRNRQTYMFWINETDVTVDTMEEWTLPDGTTTLTCGLVKMIDVYQEDGDRVTGSTVNFSV